MSNKVNRPLLAVLVLAGCAQPVQQLGPRVVPIATPYDQAEATALLVPGTATIQGSAFLRQRGGGVVTCAGSVVRLIPATAYARARATALYGPTQSGIAREALKFDPDPAAYETTLRTTKCDAQGKFSFENVAAGAFLVQTLVTWRVGAAMQGGALMQTSITEPGKVSTVLLTE